MVYSSQKFNGLTGGSSYDYNMYFVPHYEELQNAVQNSLHSYFNTLSDVGALKVIEIGAGTGITSECILKAHPSLLLEAIEKEPSMIAEARKKLCSEERVHLIEADAIKHLKSMDCNSTFAIASAETLHTMQPAERKDLIDQIYKVLRPGGLFVNVDKIAQIDQQTHAAALRDQLTLIDSVFSELGHEDLKQEWIKHYEEDDKFRIDEITYETLLKDVGFSSIKRTHRWPLEAAFVCFKPNS